MSQHRGDDLDDDFVPDDLVALSGEESDEDVPSAEDGREFFTAEDDQPQPQRGAEIGNTDKKRKRREKDKQRKAKVSFLSLCVYYCIGSYERKRNES